MELSRNHANSAIYENSGKTKAGTKTNSLASHVDLAKTIAEFAGVTTSDYPGLVGESFAYL